MLGAGLLASRVALGTARGLCSYWCEMYLPVLWSGALLLSSRSLLALETGAEQRTGGVVGEGSKMGV